MTQKPTSPLERLLDAIVVLLDGLASYTKKEQGQTEGPVADKSDPSPQDNTATAVCKIELPQALTDQYIASQKARDEMDGKKGERDVQRLGIERNSLTLIAAGTVFTAFAMIFTFCNLQVANKQSNIAQQGLEAVQRAFVHQHTWVWDLGTFIVDAKGIKSQRWQIKTTLENSGATPAIDVVHVVNTSPPFAEPGEADFARVNSGRVAVSAIGPKTTKTTHGMDRAEVDIIGPALSGALRGPLDKMRSMALPKNYYVWGWVGYTDVFQKQHITEFCTRVAGLIRGEKPDDIKVATAGCWKYDCVDEACPNYASMLKLYADILAKHKPK